MTKVRMTAHLEAPIERVFEIGTDFKRYPEWNVSYEEVREVTPLPLAVGTRIHGVMKLLGRKMEGWAEVVELDRPKYIRFKGVGPENSALTTIYRLTPAGLGTDIEFEGEYELPAGLFGQVVDRLFVEQAVERALKHTVENFKALVEARQPVLA